MVFVTAPVEGVPKEACYNSMQTDWRDPRSARWLLDVFGVGLVCGVRWEVMAVKRGEHRSW